MRRQKTRPLALLLSLGLVLGLAGCGSMLERSYASVTPHTQFSDESDSGSVLRAETYQGLVSALLHLVEQGAGEGRAAALPIQQRHRGRRQRRGPGLLGSHPGGPLRGLRCGLY